MSRHRHATGDVCDEVAPAGAEGTTNAVGYPFDDRIGGPGAYPGEVDRRVWNVTFQRAMAVVGRKWVVHIVRALEPGPRRMFQISNAIPEIQDKVLRSTLATMLDEGLVRRVLVEELTGTGVGWELTDVGRSLVEPLGAIFRWSRDHLLSQPAPSAP